MSVVSNVERYVVFLENDHAVKYVDSNMSKVPAVLTRCGHFVTCLPLVTFSDHNFKNSKFFCNVSFPDRSSLPDNVCELSSFVSNI